MNEIIETIRSRRSHRKYREEQIGEAELQAIVESAIYAPSAMNQQKWHFTVVQDRVMLDNMVLTLKENMVNSGNEMMARRAGDPGFNPFYNAPTVVLITADENAPFTQLDCGAAAENMALAAESQNIGSCLIAMSGFIFESENSGELKKELGVPEGYKHILSVALGYKDNENPPTPQKDIGVINYIKEPLT
jgi:nitroreductase